ncbi:MAG: sugar ABC transporter ATP-binding protein [Spirochaetales bacterium]|nr:sugar ABC transporter ATP-binding protein [Spirochaetales bacterium]
MGESAFALQMNEVSKQFPGTLAVNKVSFEVRPGEVHALMGENGAGKSTLMKILAGSYADYTGEILIDGKPVQLHNPHQAKSEGVGMVYQELSIAYNRSVEENMFAGNIPTKGIFVDQEALRKQALASLAKVKLEDKIDPGTEMKNISQHESQLIEMAKVLNDNPKILVMDEPTSALSSTEVQMLFDIIREIKKQGVAIVYISHHLPEIFEVADRVTVLRDGKKIDTCDIKDVDNKTLVEMMIGEKIDDFVRSGDSETGDVILKVENLTHYGFVHNISFQLNHGEILGIVGLAGSGRTELGRCLSGADKVDYGTVILDDEAITVKSMSQMLEKGIAYLSENRKTEGLALRLSNKNNILSSIISRLSRFFFFLPKKGTPILQDQYEKLTIYPHDPEITTSNLSGGNQQKVLLAKWLSTKPKVLILDEPTRGVDVGAKKLIHETIVKLAEEGLSVILLSSDLPELVALSDRVAVMRQGHLIGELKKEDGFDENKVLLAANGERGVFSVEY